MNKTKVNLIGGFLGSGKTTLLRHILSAPRLPKKIALMINEIGEVVIDAKVLKSLGSGVVEMPNGCICCSVSGDFIQGLLDIKKNFSPDRILVEPTGIAEPGKILSALYQPPLETEFRVEPTVIVLDVSGFEKLYRQISYLYVMQIKTADIILLNKMDLVNPKIAGKVEREVQKLNPRAFILWTEHCKIELLDLLEGKRVQLAPSVSKTSHAPLEFDSFTFKSDKVFSKERIEKFLGRLPANIFRLKGFVRLREGLSLLNYVTGQIEWEPFDAGESQTTLTCIGRKLDSKKIISELVKCEMQNKGEETKYAKNSHQKSYSLAR